MENDMLLLGGVGVLLIACVAVLGIGHLLAWGEARHRLRQSRERLDAHVGLHGDLTREVGL